MRTIKIIVEKHENCFIAYPLGIQGGVVGEGDTFDEALKDVRSAIRAHIEVFGEAVLSEIPDVEETYLAEYQIV